LVARSTTSKEAPVFEEFGGIPMHPLLVHAAVVFVPLLALAAIGYAFVPFVRPHIRWVLAGLAVVAPGAAWFARLSGQAFFNRGIERKQITEGFIPVIQQHQHFGQLTSYYTTALGVLTLVLVYLVAPRAAAATGSLGSGSLGTGSSGTGSSGTGPAWRSSPALRWIVAALVAVAGVVSIYYVIRTGDSGAHAVWEGR
jgi:hypothetical protein